MPLNSISFNAKRQSIEKTLVAIIGFVAIHPSSGWSVPPTNNITIVNGSGSIGTVNGNVEKNYTTVVNGPTKKQREQAKKDKAESDKRFLLLEAKIDNRNWQDIKNDPFFKTFAANKYKKHLMSFISQQWQRSGQIFQII